ncbi:MAG: filamentous hemagglutinin N-terminal domain-containing protein, partial [Proteobacteria bacterium]|nr:filamentous hemagglutinin N-terminal domain-containing protein [Pseudomonadota bacterium]
MDLQYKPTRSSHSRPGLARLALVSFLVSQLLVPGFALAGVEGANVVHGQAEFSVSDTDPNHTIVNVGTQNAIIDYQKFGVAAGETLQFIQPNEAARVLNRVADHNATRIDGTLLANGQVYILNPAGVFFGGEAVVDVNRLVAAAGALSNQDFLAGVDRFTDLVGTVENAGLIQGHDIALLGNHVVNTETGRILSDGGAIVMTSGDEVLIGQHGSPLLIKFHAPETLPIEHAAVENRGLLDAGRGSVRLAAGDLAAYAIRQSGSIRGREILVDGGQDGGVLVAGTLDATSDDPNESGGSIHVLGGDVVVASATLDASGAGGGGEVKVGGDRQGQGELRRARNVTITQDSVLRADATEDGDGGEVIVFSEGNTNVFGQLSAIGGVHGGNGGFIETSGLEYVYIDRAPDVWSHVGEGGTWLIDPADITI